MKKPLVRAFIRRSFLFLLLAAPVALTACSGGRKDSAATVIPTLPLGPEIPAGSVPAGEEKYVQGPLSSTLRVMNAKNKIYLEVESVLSPSEFASLRNSGAAGLSSAMLEIKTTLKSVGAITTAENSEVGYVKFWLPYQRDMLGGLKDANFTHELYMSPAHYDFDSLKQAKSFTPQKLGFTAKSGAPSSNSPYSGLASIHAPDFVAAAEKEIGEKIDGSSSRLGITDTGITYRHPTFTDTSGKNSRVVYMKDFSREGRVYFNPASSFAAVENTDAATATDFDFTVNAQYLETSKLPQLPSPTDYKVAKDLKLKASAALKADLKNPALKSFFGYLNEAVYQGGESAVDLNANGKLDDRIPMIFVADPTHLELNRVYVAFAGQAKPDALLDFSSAVALPDFNTSKVTTPLFAERVGFALKVDQLAEQGADEPTTVLSASLVGFDPGNHGTHVAGIAAGRKTISNDSDDTLARGVAPNAQILSDRVCANNGGCNASEAMIDLAVNGKVDVINMSLGSLSPFNDGYGAQETLVNRITTLKNVLFVISAGNSGPGRQTVGSPSVARKALSVAATANRGMIESQYEWPGVGAPTAGKGDDFVLYFSSRGPTAAGGFAPNIAAPGTELSSVQLNSAPGSHAGLDVYWGTSMAAPVVTGAYALFLDAIRKYNVKHPTSLLPTDVETLRSVLLASARPFAADRYTWIDEGAGMVDLSAAWKKILSLKSDVLSTGVTAKDGSPVALDYQVITSAVMANGTAYDGSRAAQVSATDAVPAFGSGIYFNANDKSQLKKAFLSRTLPESAASGADAGDLTVQLVTSKEEFALRSDFGHDEPWAIAGVQSDLDCIASPVSNVSIFGRGVEINRGEDGKGEIVNYSGSDINICLDRAKIALLAPGDHAALVYGYRVVGGKVAALPSFTIPLYMTVPHSTLASSTAYEISGTVRGFEVARNYVAIPAGTSIVRITLEAPENKAGESKCSNVLLEMLEGGNTKEPSEDATKLRAANCTSQGAPNPKPLKAVITRTNPTPGIWDIHLLGVYNVSESAYKLRVDYAVGEASVAAIAGDESVLNGSFDWKLKENSFAVPPSMEKSHFILNSLSRRENTSVKAGTQIAVNGPNGAFHTYDAAATKVTIATGGSAGNDLDLIIAACPATATTAADIASCEPIAQSGGPTDEESASFVPKAGLSYVFIVDGFAVKDDGKFFCDETIGMPAEKGTLAIAGSPPNFTANYSFDAAAVASSVLLKSPLYTSKAYDVRGEVSLHSDDDVNLITIPVTVTHL